MILTVSVLLLLPIAAIVALYVPLSSTFSVEATTGYLRVKSIDKTLQWHVENATVTLDPLLGDFEPILFTGQIEVFPDTLTQFQIGPDREMLVEISRPEGGPVARFSNATDEPDPVLDGDVVIVVPAASATSVVWPIIGHVVLGDVAVERISSARLFLNKARVTVLGKSLLSDARFEAGEHQLTMGDRLEILGCPPTSALFTSLFRACAAPTTAFGLVTTTPAPDSFLRVSYHAHGRRGLVDRFGTRGFEIRPSVWARLASDPVFQTLLLVVAPLMPALAAVLGVALRREVLYQRQRRLPPANHDENGMHSGRHGRA